MDCMRGMWITAKATLATTALLFLAACGGGNSTPSEPTPPPPPPPIALTQLSRDTFTNPESQHATQVEPGLFASGATLVAAFQVGRIHNGGSSDIGFATSTDAGASWTNGLLPALTQFQGGGPYFAASDPTVAFDQSHGVWIIASLAIGNGTDTVVSAALPTRTPGPIPLSSAPATTPTSNGSPATTIPAASSSVTAISNGTIPAGRPTASSG